MTQNGTSVRLVYSKDFILQYSNIQKTEPIIHSLLSPFTSPQKKINSPSTLGAKNRKKSAAGQAGAPLMVVDQSANSKLLPRTEPRGKAPLMKENMLPSQPSPSQIPTHPPLSPAKPAVASPPMSPRLRPPPTKAQPLSPAKPPHSHPSTPNIKAPPKTPNFKAYLLPPPAGTPPQKSPRRPNQPDLPHAAMPLTPPASPRTQAASPLRSPRSPARPISPLDDQRLSQRQKQIDYGYRTMGYLRYRLLVPKEQRKADFPRTPKKNQGCSKRSWDGQLKKWRRDLHAWDPESVETFRAVLESDLVKNIILSSPELEEIVRIVKEKMDHPELNDEDSDDCPEEPSKAITTFPSIPAAPDAVGPALAPVVPQIVEVREPGSATPPTKTVSLDVGSKKKLPTPSRIDDSFTRVARRIDF
eukprot:TRINITY_DN4765_c0_g1_i1.p1 TRINITY_DN4765_c0_g1~~TRINITY_DN4765_c0_g1_i1.p1  ORF type:complete len:415 (-),score=108.52 TRINITY_DN4765_c0_g1_i1:111-1355(-)